MGARTLDDRRISYITAFAILFGISIPVNYFAGTDLNGQNELRENLIVSGMLVSTLVPLPVLR